MFVRVVAAAIFFFLMLGGAGSCAAGSNTADREIGAICFIAGVLGLVLVDISISLGTILDRIKERDAPPLPKNRWPGLPKKGE